MMSVHSIHVMALQEFNIIRSSTNCGLCPFFIFNDTTCLSDYQQFATLNEIEMVQCLPVGSAH